MDPATTMIAVAAGSIAATNLSIHGPHAVKSIRMKHLNWKTHWYMFSIQQNPEACQAINFFLFSQQSQIICSGILIPYVHIQGETSFRYMMKIPPFNKSFKMKCIYGSIYIVPLSVDNINLSGYKIYVYKRKWSNFWSTSDNKVNMLNYFMKDLLKTSKIELVVDCHEPSIINHHSKGKFIKTYYDFLMSVGKINGIKMFCNDLHKRVKSTGA